jgi:hypothetical protein
VLCCAVVGEQKAGLNVVLCVGETLAEREAGKTLEVVKAQIAAAAKEIKARGATFLFCLVVLIFTNFLFVCLQPFPHTASHRTGVRW